MPVAIVGIAAVGLGIAFAASENDRMSKEAQDRADEAAKQRDEAYKNMINLAKEQYNRWEQDFGEIQTEVADYYKNLTDDILKQQYEDANTEANQSLIQQYFASQQKISSQFNKTGMAGSGAEAASALKLQQSMLQQKATNRWQTQQLKANANNVLMGQKASWVSQGENLRNQAMQNQFNAEQVVGNDAAAQYLQYQKQAYNAEQNMINTTASGLTNIGGMMMGFGSQMYTANQTNDTNIAIAKILAGNNQNSTITNKQVLPVSQVNNISNYYRDKWVNDTISGVAKNNFINTNTKTTSLYFGAR